MSQAIPDSLRRFLLTGALTVPHVEAILQLRHGSEQPLDAGNLAARLYLRAANAAEVLADLSAMGVTERVGDDPPSYRYHPASTELSELLDQLDVAYTTQLVAVTRLIHSMEQRKALDFSNAFRWRRDT